MENNVLVNANSKEKLVDVIFQETCEADNGSGSRVLGVTASSRVTGCEVLKGELRASVKTSFRIIKCGESGNCYSETAETESTHTISDANITPSAFALLTATVTNCEKSVSAVVRCKASVSLGGWYLKERSVSFLSAANENLFCKTALKKIENVTPAAGSELALNFTDEARMPIETLLDYCGGVNIANVYPSGGSYRVEGDVNYRVLTIADNGEFVSQSYSHPFATDIPDEKVDGDTKLDIEGWVDRLSFSVTESDKRVIVCDVTLKFAGTAASETEIESVSDAYSTTNEIKITSEEQSVSTHFCLRSVREKASAVIKADGGATEILGLTSPMTEVDSSVQKGDGLTVDGIIRTTVLYLNEDNKFVSLDAEVPFSSVIGNDYTCESIFSPSVNVSAINARLRGGVDIEITVELMVTVRGVSDETLGIVSGVEIGAEKEQDDFAISLYIVKQGETLWDVAKYLNTDEAKLAEQNADVEMPLKGGEKIILYKNL
jgi:hypothetical protein